MPFPDASFDAAGLQHASMNIEVKEELFRQIYRVLRPRGRLALHEVLAARPADPLPRALGARPFAQLPTSDW
jgi:ubiquinone/menaquinone biosynthesis C-methylase UbiE